MDWGKALMRYAEGANPEMFSRARAQREEQINNEQRRNLLAAQEGRSSEQFAHEKGNWSTEDQLLMEKLKAAGLSTKQAELVLKDSQNKLDTFSASGGAAGEAKRTDEEHQAKLSESKARVTQAQNAVAMAKNENEREAALHQYRIEKAKLDQEIGTATKPAIIEQQFDKANPRERYDTGISAITSLLRPGGAVSPEAAGPWLDRAAGLMDQQAQADAERKARLAKSANVIPGSIQQSESFNMVKPQPTKKKGLFDFFLGNVDDPQ